MRSAILLTALLALPLTACGGGSADPKEAAYAAYSEQDYAKAAEHFEAALEGKTSADADYHELKVDHARALAHVDADKVPDAVAALAEQVTLSAIDYRNITTDLVTAKQFTPAVLVMDQGMKAFPDDAKMVAVKDRVIEESEKAGDVDALKALAGLGYGGGGD